MAAKLLHSLTDDNPDLQKQIGCMTGIFQLFDRQQILSSRRIVGHSPKRLLPGTSDISNDTFGKERSQLQHRNMATEKHTSKSVQEKQRLSTESSRASFSSSSRSSSFSSLDCNRMPPTEPLSFDRLIFPDTPSRDKMNHPNASPQSNHPNLDLRDVVKDSMYREPQGLSAKNTTREEAATSFLKNRDSPRPSQLSNTNSGSYGPGSSEKQNSAADLKESLRVLAKLREAPWYLEEPRELSRSKSYQSKDGSLFSNAKDAPRFSYDGREFYRLSSEPRDASKSTSKLKELPRLSLDSRESSMRSLNSESKPTFISSSTHKDSGKSNTKFLDMQQTSASQARSTSVVAKLMGLEALPGSVPATDSKLVPGRTDPVKDSFSLPRSLDTSKQVSSSSKSLWKEPNSPRWKNPDSVMKPTSRFPIEPAPWKQIDRSQNSQKQPSRNLNAPLKNHSPFPSVYSEIEKRLKDLEFTQSGKDLRALKQILEAMQAKGLLERKETQDLGYTSQIDDQQKFTSSVQTARLLRQNDQVSTSAKKGQNPSRKFESPIVIMKPAKLVEKAGIPASSVISLNGLSGLSKPKGGAFMDERKSSVNNSSVKDQITRSSRHAGAVSSIDNRANSRELKSAKTSTRSQQLIRESTTCTVKSSGSISPRLQQKQKELEKRSRPPTPPSDSSRSRRQSNRQQTESNSPGGRRRPKFSNSQTSDDQLSDISSGSRHLSYHEIERFIQSEDDIPIDSKLEVSSSERAPEVSSCQSPSTKAGESMISGSVEKNCNLVLSEDESLLENAVVALEYPSPVSVLDHAVYMENSPLPVKHISIANTDYRSQDAAKVSSATQYNPSDLVSDVRSGLTSEINRQKLQNIENLVQKLRRLNSSHDEARTDYIASLCENTNPDHRYISEILLASGLLLRDLGSSLTTFQFHSSGHPINPELFLVLEQTKASTLVKEECISGKAVLSIAKEKHHRKLIFDIVNEILAGKLALTGPSSEPWLRHQKVARNRLNAQKLLRELCFEVDQMQARILSDGLEDQDDGLKSILREDVMHRSGKWADFNGEISDVVLDVERMIFKDLVNEIVVGEASSLSAKPVRRRQLFKK